MKYTEIRHWSHIHDLVLEEADVPYICWGCKQLGFAVCYQCKPCSFHLHEDCAHPKPSASHEFLKGCSLVFRREPPTNPGRYCDACGDDVEGFWYQCTHQRPHDLHPCCLNLPRRLTNESTGVSIRLSDTTKSVCVWCKSRKVKQGVKGWCYVSSDGERFHIACFRQALLESWKNGYFREHLHGYSVSSGRELMQTAGGAAGKTEMLKHSGSGCSKTVKVLAKILLFVRLVVSAFFGDPTAVIVALFAETLT